MKFLNKDMWRGFANQADLINTLNGGVSMTSFNVTETNKDIVINVSAPSVRPESFNVFVDHSKLIVFSLINNEKDNDLDLEERLNLPLFYKQFDIPFHVDGNKIDAVYENGKLKITLPFKKNGIGLQRKIDIKNLQ